jgi:hypothetical protein
MRLVITNVRFALAKVTLGAAPKFRDGVNRHESRKTEREHGHVRECGERRLAEAQQRDREVVANHTNLH